MMSKLTCLFVNCYLASFQGLYDVEDDDESVSTLPSKQMKITTTNSFLHNVVRDDLNSPHHTILIRSRCIGCSFTGFMLF